MQPVVEVLKFFEWGWSHGMSLRRLFPIGCSFVFEENSDRSGGCREQLSWFSAF